MIVAGAIVATDGERFRARKTAPTAPFFLATGAVRLRHNRHMHGLRTLLLACLSLLILPGCGEAPGPRDPLATRRAAPATSSMEFHGRRPCVDCAGIDAWLQLEQGGEVRRYALVERYLHASGERRFEERGDWTSGGDLLQLRSDEGGLRVYARLPDHSLQARASNGEPLAAAADDVMVPTTFDNPR